MSPPSDASCDAFLYLQRSDVEHHARHGSVLGDRTRLFIDPGLLDDAVRLGLDPSRFRYQVLPVDRRLNARVQREAATRAAALDQRLTRERGRLFGRGGPMDGWDQESMRLFLVRLLLARELGEACARTFGDLRIGLARPANPQVFYFDSFACVEAFTAASPTLRVVEHHGPASIWVPGHAEHCLDAERIAALAADGAAEAITHLPTCYRDFAFYEAAITRAFPRSVDLPSPFWDLPLRRAEPLLRRVDALPRDEVFALALEYRERAGRAFDDALADLIPSREALHLQADTLADRAFVQALDYQRLLAALRGTCPQVIVADHDTGTLGPLFSVAARLQAPITVLPHSAYPAFELPHALRVTAVERVGFSTPVRTVLGEPVPVRPVQLGTGPAPIERARVAKVCLLLNGLHGQGLAHVDLDGLAGFRRRLDAVCRAAGVELAVRLKPNSPALDVAATAFGMSGAVLKATLEQPLEALAAATDLCVCWGESTTGVLEFLYRGALVLHVDTHHGSADVRCSPPFANDGTVPRLDADEALDEIAVLLADPACFAARVRAQRERLALRLDLPASPLFPETRAGVSASAPTSARESLHA